MTQTTGKVIGLHQRMGYRPDLAALARHQITTAREKLGLTHEQFADRLGRLLSWRPSAEIVASWETDATPPGDVILAAGIASQGGRDILPIPLTQATERVMDLVDALCVDIERIAGAPDVVRAYAMRGLIARPEWNKLIRGSRQHLWLYGMAEMGYAIDDQVPGIIAEAAAAGCEVRVLLLDPEYPATADIDLDEGNPAGTLAPRIRASLARFHVIRQNAGDLVQLRVYNAAPTVSIIRGDGRMLVTPYMRFFAGSNSPTFELADTPEGRTFDRYARHFENMWAQAKEWTP
jgi:transcriptional regulator with XRE-family HTH domain